MEWISVKQRMPESDKTVIAVITFRHRTNQVVFASYQGDCWFMKGGIIAKNEISHWMPLPEPQKGA